MPFRPNVGDTLLIEGTTYSVAEHPVAPGIPYGQEGRAAIVYQLVAGGERRALKVFKARYQLPALVTQAERIEVYATMSGLQVCKRTVITARRHIELVRQFPDLAYAVLMPWIEGPTWMEVLIHEHQFTRERSLWLGRAMAEVLAGMEERGLAHCDLSGPNILVPALAGQQERGSSFAVELVDVEQMYAPGLQQPEYIPSGSSGYAHRTAPSGLWNARADRFSGALLLAEMLGWCDERVRGTAWGESYFDPEEMQRESERYRILTSALREHWGEGVANLLEQAWRSDVLADCPTFARWLAAMPDQESLQPASQATSQPLPGNATLATGPAVWSVESGQPAQQTGQGYDTALAGLFDDALAAYNMGKWAQARELFTELVRRRPDYSKVGRQAAALLADIERQMHSQAMPVMPTTAEPQPVAPTMSPFETSAHGQPSPTQPGVALAGGPESSAALASQFSAAESVTSPEEEARPGLVREGQNRKWIWAALAAVVLLVVALLAYAGISAYQAQQAEQAAATQTADAQAAATQQVIDAATAQVVAAETAQAEGEIQTSVAQVTGTEVALEAESTRQAQAGATRQAGGAATAEAQARGTALAIQAALTASPKPPAFSLENKDRIAALRRLRGNVDGVRTLAFSPDSQMIATTSTDKKIRLWKVADGTLVRTLEGQEEVISALAFAPGGKILASSSYDGIRLWEIDTGLQLANLREHEDRVGSLAFSPDGTLLVSGSDDKTARIWRVADGTVLHVLSGHREYLTDVAFSPDGKSVATSSMDSTVRIWNVADGSLIRELSGPKGDLLVQGATTRGEKGENVKTEGGVISLAFSPDGKRVAAGAVEPEGDSAVYTVWMWTVEDGVPERVLKGADAPVDSLAFSPDGQVVAGNGSYQGVVGLLRAQDGVVLRLLEGHTSSVYQLVFSPDGQLLATGAADGTAVIWGIPQGNEPATPAPVQSNIGGTAEMDGLKITLNSVRHAQEGVTQSNGSAEVPGDGREFVFANVTLENTTDKPKPLYLPGEVKILNTWKNVIVPVDSTGSYKIADALAEKAGNELAPHAKVTGEMAFRLSLDDKDLTLEYWPMLSPGSIVFKLDR